jgi:hypothetical protein
LEDNITVGLRDMAWIGFNWLSIGSRSRLVSTQVIEGKRPLGRVAHSWEDNNRMDVLGM